MLVITVARNGYNSMCAARILLDDDDDSHCISLTTKIYIFSRTALSSLNIHTLTVDMVKH